MLKKEIIFNRLFRRFLRELLLLAVFSCEAPAIFCRGRSTRKERGHLQIETKIKIDRIWGEWGNLWELLFRTLLIVS